MNFELGHKIKMIWPASMYGQIGTLISILPSSGKPGLNNPDLWDIEMDDGKHHAAPEAFFVWAGRPYMEGFDAKKTHIEPPAQEQANDASEDADDDSAFPQMVRESVGDVSHTESFGGLTKREYFAAHSGITIQDAKEYLAYMYPNRKNDYADILAALADLRTTIASVMIASLSVDSKEESK